MRQVKIEDLQKETEGVSFEVTEENIDAVFKATTGAIQQGRSLMYFRPTLSAETMPTELEQVELVFPKPQDFQTIADIWAWLFAKEGNKIRGNCSGDLYTLVKGQAVCLNPLSFEAKGRFITPDNYSKAISWEDNLSKEKPLLCWVGDTKGSAKARRIINEIVGYASGKYKGRNGLTWEYAIPLNSTEILAFLATYKEVVCD